MPVESQDFIAAMRLFPAAVNIITTGTPGRRAGLTATAVMSLTADPPQVAVAVNRNASAHPLILPNGYFCVNTLAEGHDEIARAFSGALKGEARFSRGEWVNLITGAPALADAVVSLDCRLTQALDFSSHTLLIGRVEAVIRNSSAKPLLYLDGRFAVSAELRVVQR